jgi:hypothetical protein
MLITNHNQMKSARKWKDKVGRHESDPILCKYLFQRTECQLWPIAMKWNLFVARSTLHRDHMLAWDMSTIKHIFLMLNVMLADPRTLSGILDLYYREMSLSCANKNLLRRWDQWSMINDRWLITDGSWQRWQANINRSKPKNRRAFCWTSLAIASNESRIVIKRTEMSAKGRDESGIELETSHDRSANHTTRPFTRRSFTQRWLCDSILHSSINFKSDIADISQHRIGFTNSIHCVWLLVCRCILRSLTATKYDELENYFVIRFEIFESDISPFLDEISQRSL